MHAGVMRILTGGLARALAATQESDVQYNRQSRFEQWRKVSDF